VLGFVMPLDLMVACGELNKLLWMTLLCWLVIIFGAVDL